VAHVGRTSAVSAATVARAWLVDRGGALVVAAGGAYAWLAPAYPVGGDATEMATLGAVGGIAHPSGYPLAVLWLRAWAWLPGSPAHHAALATAVVAAAVVAVLHAAARAWGAKPTGATLAVALFASAPMVVRLSTEPEVFALNNLAVAAVLWLAAAAGPARGTRRALALGLVAGLGLANHLTCALVAPVGLLGVVRAVREAGWRAALAAAGALLVGLALYGYALIAPHTAASWGDVRTPGDVIDLVLRRDYGGAGAFAGGRDPVSASASLGALFASLGRAWWYAPGAAGLVALAWRAARAAASGEPRLGWCALAVSWLLAGPLLVTRFDLPPESVFLWMVQRFHVLPTLLLAIPVAVALDRVTTRLRPAVGAALGVAVFAGALAMDLPALAVRHSSIVDDGVHNILGGLPPDAILAVAPDDLVFGTRYAQLVDRERPDVLVVAWPMLSLPWYRARVAAAGLPLPDGPEPASLRLARAALATGRPLFVDSLATDVLAALPHYPIGGVFRVLPPGSKPPPLDELLARNRELFLERYVLAPTPSAEDDWSAEVFARYARTWAELGQLLEAAGRTDEAGHAYGLASQLHPGTRASE
jgi:hypothetical protein